MPIQLGVFDRLDTLEKLTRLGDPLAVLDRIVPFEIFRTDLPRTEPSPKGGRPAYDAVRMFKLLVIQHLYRLSDEQLEYQTLDRLSFQRFVGIERSHQVPDFTTVWRFRERLGEEGARALFVKLGQYIDVAGFTAKGGQIIDASIVSTGKSRRDPKESTVPTRQEAAHRDEDAAYTKKHGQSFHGYKVHVNVDEGEGFVREVAVTPANVHDGHLLDELTTAAEKGRSRAVYADAAYVGAENEAMLEAKGLIGKIAHKRKPKRPLTKRQREQNRRWSRSRALVEHVFARQVGSRLTKRTVAVVGLARVTVKLVLDQVAYNLSRLSFHWRKAAEKAAEKLAMTPPTGLVCPQ